MTTRSYLLDEPYAPSDGVESPLVRGLLESLPPAQQGSVSVAIYGPWGVGKTSLLKQIQSACEAHTATVYFEPWRYEKDEALILPLLSEMAAALAPRTPAKTNRLLDALRDTASKRFTRLTTRLLGRAARFALRAGATSLLGQHGLTAVDSLETFGADVLTAYQGNASRTFEYPESEVKAFSRDFRELVALGLGRENHMETSAECPIGCKGRVFVFVDDLDRCAPNQIRRLLESLKTFLWEQDVCFVFALDRHQVELAVAETYLPYFESLDSSLYMALERSARYLDKFFPFHIDLSESATRFDSLIVDQAKQGYWNELQSAFPDAASTLDALSDFYQCTDRNLRRAKAAARWVHLDLAIDPDRDITERQAAFSEFVFAQSYPRLWVEYLQNCGFDERPGIYLTISIIARELVGLAELQDLMVDLEMDLTKGDDSAGEEIDELHKRMTGIKFIARLLADPDADKPESHKFVVTPEAMDAAATLAGTSIGSHLAQLSARSATERLKQINQLTTFAYKASQRKLQVAS